MKKIILCLSAGAFLVSCNNADKGTTAASADSTSKSTVSLPYTATFSSSFTDAVPDSALSTVLMSYKDFSDGDVKKSADAFADTVEWLNWDGSAGRYSRAGMVKMGSGFRDSLSSLKYEMEAWAKMYSTDKKASFILTWYKETDTYKNGKVDSARYHDINRIKDGKIDALESYKMVLKK
jgi:hypothetical protein